MDITERKFAHAFSFRPGNCDGLTIPPVLLGLKLTSHTLHSLSMNFDHHSIASKDQFLHVSLFSGIARIDVLFPNPVRVCPMCAFTSHKEPEPRIHVSIGFLEVVVVSPQSTRPSSLTLSGAKDTYAWWWLKRA